MFRARHGSARTRSVPLVILFDRHVYSNERQGPSSQDAKVREALSSIMRHDCVTHDASGNAYQDMGGVLTQMQLLLERCISAQPVQPFYPALTAAARFSARFLLPPSPAQSPGGRCFVAAPSYVGVTCFCVPAVILFSSYHCASLSAASLHPQPART